MTSKDRQKMYVLAGIMGITFLYVYVVYLIQPMKVKSGQLKQQLVQAETKLRTIQLFAGKLAALESEHAALIRDVEQWSSRLASLSEVPKVIEELSGFASQTGIRIQAILPQSPQDMSIDEKIEGVAKVGKKAVYQRVPIQIDALGGFHEVSQFIEKIEIGGRPMSVVSIRVTGLEQDTKNHRAQLLIESYHSLETE